MSAKKKSVNDRLKIVIAEDSPTQAEQLKYILETNGYQVTAASNGKEALALTRSERPDIVITDIVMPEMDGYELCKQIKMDEELKDVPVILLTALSDPADVIKGLECGADNFVTKPYDERVLLSRIEYLRLNWRLQETKQVRMGVEITFSGRKYFITSDRLQILNLLLSTYESAVGKNRELEQAQAELRRLNEQLEQRVKERTADLLKTNEKLELEIAERKMAQERIIHLNSVLRAVRGVNQLITHGPDRERLIEQSCELLVKTRGFLCAWILLFDEKKKYISAAVTGGKETRAFYQQLKRGDYPPCIDKILAQKDSLAICGDIVENGLDCLPRSLYSGGSGLIGRLEYRGKVYGIISTYIQSDYSHDPEEQSLFRELAGDIAFALNDIEGEEERRRTQEALHKSENLYRSLFENMLNGFAYCQMLFDQGKPVDWVYLTVNSAFEVLTGLKNVVGKKVSEVIPGIQSSNPELFEIYGRIALTGIPERFETCLPALDMWFSVSIYSPGKEYFVAVFDVITERKKAEEQLRIAEQNFRNSLNDSPLGIRIITADGDLLYANKAILDTYGYSSAEELRTTPVKERYTPESYAEHQKRKELRRLGKPVPSNYEISIARKDGEIRHLIVSRKEVTWNGKTQFQVIYEDITERKKMQAQLMAQDRLASIGQLASGIAHELNNPLTSVIGFSELLMEKDLPKDVKEDLETINREAKRTASVVKGLLTFARKQKTEKEPIDINSIIQGVLQLRSYEQRVSNIEVDTRFVTDLPQVSGNGAQLQQVFINIIINAEQAMLEAHGRGKLTIATEQVGDIVKSSVADDGPGISLENMRRLFTPFFTTKEVGKGTGLGLSICHGIITEHSGKIYAESEPGKGATFVVELPISK